MHGFRFLFNSKDSVDKTDIFLNLDSVSQISGICVIFLELKIYNAWVLKSTMLDPKLNRGQSFKHC